MKLAITLVLTVFLSACSLWKSDGKKILEEKAFTCFNNQNCNTVMFKSCYQSPDEPLFINEQQLDEFTLNATVSGFLDSKKFKFWSYTFKNNFHLFCESSLPENPDLQTPHTILEHFSKLVEEQM